MDRPEKAESSGSAQGQDSSTTSPASKVDSKVQLRKSGESSDSVEESALSNSAAASTKLTAPVSTAPRGNDHVKSDSPSLGSSAQYEALLLQISSLTELCKVHVADLTQVAQVSY